MNFAGCPFARSTLAGELPSACSVRAHAAERLCLSPEAFRYRTRAAKRTVPANKPRRLITQTTSAVAAMFIAGVAVGAALVMSKPRQIVAWSLQPVPVKIAP
jgi:hypothetical protein